MSVSGASRFPLRQVQRREPSCGAHMPCGTFHPTQTLRKQAAQQRHSSGTTAAARACRKVSEGPVLGGSDQPQQASAHCVQQAWPNGWRVQQRDELAVVRHLVCCGWAAKRRKAGSAAASD